jgi:hypothetical protein
LKRRQIEEEPELNVMAVQLPEADDNVDKFTTVRYLSIPITPIQFTEIEIGIYHMHNLRVLQSICEMTIRHYNDSLNRHRTKVMPPWGDPEG